MNQKPTNEPHTVHQAVESFLAKQRVRVNAGEISAGYYDLLQRSLNEFADHVGRRVSVNNITGHVLESYHTTIIQRGEWSKDYAASRMRNVKTFVNWCYDIELLDKLPRIMRRGNRVLSIETGEKKKPVFTNEEVKILLDHASERTQLYLLLMANTGCTQIDLSELRPDQVDWKTGRITRKRTKTEDSENVPEVSYPLWGRTFDLLKKYGKRKGDHVLTNEQGGELKREGLDGTRLTKCDNVATAYARLIRKLTTPKKDRKTGKVVTPPLLKRGKPLKTFRKTSPSRLEDSEYATCSRWFGGWSPKSVADKNYIRPPQEMFDKAVRWLAISYGIEK
jgi:integrase